MYELAALLEIALAKSAFLHFVKFFLDEILYGFHVVVCYLLNVLHTLGVLLGKVLVYGT